MNASRLKASCYNPKLHMHGVGGQDDKPFFPIVVSMFNFLRIFRSRPPAMEQLNATLQGLKMAQFISDQRRDAENCICEPLITIVGATGTGKSKVR